MLSSDVAIEVKNISKVYPIYNKPSDRLKQIFNRRQKYFKEFWALKDVSFQIVKGRVVGIIGANGSGKSTLLQLICGTLNPSFGNIKLEGKVAALLELGSGFNMDFTGKENVYLNASLLGLTKKEIDDKYLEITDFADIGDFIDQPVRTYSSGMLARLAFSIAINVEPEILILDEILSVGDIRFTAKCMNKMKEFKQKGVTIFFVSHDISSIRALCDEVLWIDRGILREFGDIVSITANYLEFMMSDDSLNKKTNVSSKKQYSSEHHTSIAHWGSNPGIITNSYLLNRKDEITDVFKWNEVIKIIVNLNIPKSLEVASLSVAFSIKDAKGLDLLVSTTYLNDDIDFRNNSLAKVSFEFTNYLKSGNYYLALAVEDRSNIKVKYHEYIEGKHYFSSIANDEIYGIFLPNIIQELESVNYE